MHRQAILMSSEQQEPVMNSFYDHHKDSIRFNYRCFDRILLNGLIQPFQQPERVVGFFDVYRHLYPVSRDILRGAAEQFQVCVKERAGEWNAPIVDAPKGRRDEFVDPYFKGARPDQIVVILKAREPARIMTAIGDKKANRWHLQVADRWIVQYNFYVNDQRWGRMFVRMCPYLPFSARVCLNQHHWLANRMREEGVDFQQCSNAFRKCAAPKRLQELADSLTAEDLLSCGQKWLARFTPFFSERERKQAGCQHRLFFSQIEFCDNLIFHRRTALDKLGERLLDANRTIGQPNKITVIFGRKISTHYRGKLQTEIEDMNLPNPVIRSHYRNGFIKRATLATRRALPLTWTGLPPAGSRQPPGALVSRFWASSAMAIGQRLQRTHEAADGPRGGTSNRRSSFIEAHLCHVVCRILIDGPHSDTGGARRGAIDERISLTEARRRRAQGATLAELARSYGVGKSTISRLTM